MQIKELIQNTLPLLWAFLICLFHLKPYSSQNKTHPHEVGVQQHLLSCLPHALYGDKFTLSYHSASSGSNSITNHAPLRRGVFPRFPSNSKHTVT